MNLIEQESASFDSSRCRRKWREALGDEVGVDKIFALGVMRQKLLRKGRLPCAVWPRDDIEVGGFLLVNGHCCLLVWLLLLDWC